MLHYSPQIETLKETMIQLWLFKVSFHGSGIPELENQAKKPS